MNTKIVVIDVPASVSADEASAMLSEPLTRGYYLKSASVGDPMRAVFAQYAPPEDKCPEELAAMDLVLAHRGETATMIVRMLCERGIYRGVNWVNKTRDEL